MRYPLLLCWLAGTVFLTYGDDKCVGLAGLPSTKPYPSLTQCYKYNNDACCVSAHDNIIKDAYQSLLSDACFRSFPVLEVFHCFACHPNQPSFTNESSKEISVCKSFADQIWPPTATTVYDQCGFLEDDGSGGRKVVIPSQEYKNVSLFLNAHKPPFFQGYQVKIVNDEVEGHPPCFTSSSWRASINVSVVVVTLIVAMYIG